jgi:hypothetical protein
MKELEPIGNSLEKQVTVNDESIATTIHTKKESHKQLLEGRDAMNTRIGLDQVPYDADMS